MKFGERLIEMQHVGWESHYINYDDLKKLISKIDTCITDADYKKASDAFCAELTTSFERVNEHVLAETQALRADLDPRDALSLRKAKSSLKVLRRFVGTNVIAATKIAKKHDKHVQPSLSKRLVIGNMIRASPCSHVRAYGPRPPTACLPVRAPDAQGSLPPHTGKGGGGLHVTSLGGAVRSAGITVVITVTQAARKPSYS